MAAQCGDRVRKIGALQGHPHRISFRAFRDYLAALRTAVAASRGTDGSAAAAVKTVLPQLKSVYGGWNYFDYFAQHNIEQTADELAGRKRVPAPMP